MEKHTTHPRLQIGMLCAAFFLLVVMLYLPSLDYGYISMDSDLYLEDAQLQSGLSTENVISALGRTDILYWQPLTLISHMADFELWGHNIGRHHLGNILLHALNTVLLFWLLQKYFGGFWKSVVITALFAFHPLRVESVIWMAGRKDCLSSLFFLLTIAAYLRYARSPNKYSYTLVFGCLALGLMSKPMLVTLPCILLLLDYWPTQRLKNFSDIKHASVLLTEKIPLFLLSLGSAIITIKSTGQDEAISRLEEITILDRLANITLNYTDYLSIILWPNNLAVFHPLRSAPSFLLISSACIILLSIIVITLRLKRTTPYLAVGFAWFFITLIPVSGVMQSGSQSIADRFTYLPSIGLMIALVWSLDALRHQITASIHSASTRLSAIFATTIVAAMILTSIHQIILWRNPIVLFESAIQRTENNWMAYGNLGAEWMKLGESEKALSAFQSSLLINPSQARTHLNIALLTEDPAKSIEHFNTAIALNPDYLKAYLGLAHKLNEIGSIEEAITVYPKVIQLEPENTEHYNNYAALLSELHRHKDAIPLYLKATKLDPNSIAAHYNLGLNYKQLGMPTEAIIAFKKVLDLHPEFAAAEKQINQLTDTDNKN